MVMKTTLAKDCKNYNSTCSLHVNHPQLINRNIFLYLCFGSLEVKYLCKCNMFFCKNTSLLTGCSSTNKTSACARMVIGQFVKRFFNVLCACQTSYYVRLGTLESYDNFLNKNRPVPVRCEQTPDGRRPDTVRCSADVVLPSMTLPNAVRSPWNFK